MTAKEYAEQREELVQQLERQGIKSPAVLTAMRNVRREAFVSSDLQQLAYDNAPLPIGKQQTISQPYIVALMTEALDIKPNDRILEVGTGSGYAAAVLAMLAAEVYTIERYAELASQARRELEAEQFDNVHVTHGDGTKGWPEHSPYDGISVAAGATDVPPPLLQQLRIGGRLVMPVGPSDYQRLLKVRRVDQDRYEEESLGNVRFVPLVGNSN